MIEGPSAKWNSAGTRIAVQEEAGVAGVRAADRVQRERPDDLRHAGQRFDHAERIAARPRRRPRRLRVDAHHGRHRLRRDDRLEGLTARRQPDLAGPSRRRQVDRDVRGLIPRRDRLQAVAARGGRHREPSLFVGLGHGDAVDEDRRALESAGARRAPARCPRSRAGGGPGGGAVAAVVALATLAGVASAGPASPPASGAGAAPASARRAVTAGRRVGARLDRRLGDRAAVGRRRLPVRAARGQQHERADQNARVKAAVSSATSRRATKLPGRERYKRRRRPRLPTRPRR